MKKRNIIICCGIVIIVCVLANYVWWRTQESKQEVVDSAPPIMQQNDAEVVAEMTQPIVEESTKLVIEKINTQEQKIIALPEEHKNKKKKVSRREFKQKRTKKIASKKKDAIVDNRQPSMDSLPAIQQNFDPDNSLQINSRSITIHHAIDMPTLTVKHWTGTYAPNLLTVTINNHEIPIVVDSKLVSSTPQTIAIEGNTFIMTYYYEFMGGMRKDTQTFTYNLADPQVSALNMSFNWNTPWHFAFDNAKPTT